MAMVMGWTLEIHHIDVGGGDATAIVVKNSSGEFVSKVLIDAGAEGSGSLRLAAYMQQYLGGKSFDYIIASHYHNDHIDGFRQCEVTFKNYLDVGGYIVKGEKFDPTYGTGLRSFPGFFTGYTVLIGGSGATRVKIPFIEKGSDPKNAKPLQLELGVGTGITLICYCANGILANGMKVLGDQLAKKNRKVNPNDLSLAFVLEWEDFSYFTAGDLSGDLTLKSYYNIEQALASYLNDQRKKPITAMKVNHHGSERSNFPAKESAGGFLDQLQPETLVIPCNISKNVPSPTFLDRAYTYCASKKATAVFVNDLQYHSSEPEYDEVVKMQKNPDLKCNVLLDGTTNTVSNDTRAIIIRRHSGGKDDTGRLEGDDVRISKKGYAIIIKKGKVLPEGGMISKPPNYLVGASFPALLLGAYIQPGFADQADAIINWLQMDTDRGKVEGKSYIEKYLPALAGITGRDELVQAMQDLFDETYQEKDLVYLQGKIPGYSPDNPRGNELSVEQRQTLYKLLRGNKYQATWNYYIDGNQALPIDEKKVERYSNRTAFWNDTGEPYSPENKRKAELEPEPLSKEPKTET